jgi:hypothetical protein
MTGKPGASLRKKGAAYVNDPEDNSSGERWVKIFETTDRGQTNTSIGILSVGSVITMRLPLETTVRKTRTV